MKNSKLSLFLLCLFATVICTLFNVLSSTNIGNEVLSTNQVQQKEIVDVDKTVNSITPTEKSNAEEDEYISLTESEDDYRLNLSAPMMDAEYKKAIIEASDEDSYTLENLRPLMGPDEMSAFIKLNDGNPKIYTPSEINVSKGIFKANFHMHTLNSDGAMSVTELLDKAQSYAKNLPKGEYMHIAITDHNTVLGAQEVVDVLQKNPGKYDRLKIVVGIEIFTAYNNSKVSKWPIEIHVLTWCINPWDKDLNVIFYKENLKDKWNRKKPDKDFGMTIALMKRYGIVGVAHPARYNSFLKENKYPYIKEMLRRYKDYGKSNYPLFIEGYYQSYGSTTTKEHLGSEYESYLKFINQEARSLGILRTGSTDTHGESIFKK